MAMEQNFRSALNGFNREDVVRYLEYLNTQHQNQVSQLNGEIASLRAQLDHMLMMPQADPQLLEEVTRERDALREQLAQAEAREPQPQPEQPKEEVGGLTGMAAQELEAYRRAERIERTAREKAELVYHQVSGILSQTTQRVDDISGGLTTRADEVMNQLTQLQMAVSSSKQALQEAASLLSTIRPDL